MLAMNRSEMKMTGQFNGLGRNLGLGSITRATWSGEMQRLPIDGLAVSRPAAFMKISEQEELL